MVCVSHDTVFLEKICTDVIHYEQRDVWGPYRKLVHYKGTMSHFVQLQPQAKHYFELATTDNLKFNFPDPGRLEGVRTSTQKFLEMENVDFQYPGANKKQLSSITLKMTLSTRAVLLGANGAGKTVRFDDVGGLVRRMNIHSFNSPSSGHGCISQLLLLDARENDRRRNCSIQSWGVQVLHTSELTYSIRRPTCLLSR